MKHTKRSTALILALVMVFSLTAPAYAADAPEQVAASINYDITVEFNGEAKALSNVNGQQVYPVLYGGTTYVPIRAIGYLLGLNVDWDQATRTVLLDKPANGQTADIKTAKPDDPKKTGTQAIRPTIDPGITVKYNGEAQTMKTATGAVVYPMIDGGTTYLPIRAVSNMLGLEVDWEQSTQTVKLAGKSQNVIAPPGATVTFTTPDGEVTVDLNDTAEAVSKALKAAGLSDEEIKNVLATVTNQYAKDQFKDFTETSGTSTSNKYWFIDWSTASDGYIVVKLSDKLEDSVRGDLTIYWDDKKGGSDRSSYELMPGVEYNIPLEGGSTKYTVQVMTSWMMCQHLLSEEMRKLIDEPLQASFTADIKDSASRWLVSVPEINYKNSPNVCAKALEITKGCKTDAEKITAVFNWVANNITYDHALYEDDIKTEIAKNMARKNGTYKDPGSFEGTCMDFKNPNNSNHWDISDATIQKIDDLNPDRTLANRKGVCRHYAALMTAMLRSLGIECKYVSGDVHDGKIIKGYNDDNPGWMLHAWVSVSPNVKGLDKKALGAGTDPDGWIRLDPTWGGTASGRAAASVDADHAATGWE